MQSAYQWFQDGLPANLLSIQYSTIIIDCSLYTIQTPSTNCLNMDQQHQINPWCCVLVNGDASLCLHTSQLSSHRPTDGLTKYLNSHSHRGYTRRSYTDNRFSKSPKLLILYCIKFLHNFLQQSTCS